MPMTVITVSRASPSLRGDLTKWMQEIDTGVYIGNFNTKIREHLWERVKDSIGTGQATISFRYNNELGYEFETHQTKRDCADFDGLKLVLYPHLETDQNETIKKGFSKASKFRKAQKFSQNKSSTSNTFIVLDIETDGLESKTNNIIEIGALKVTDGEIESLECLINTIKDVPVEITKLTGITRDLLENSGVPISVALESLIRFISNYPIVGYSVNFDVNFINSELERLSKPKLNNKTIDLLKIVKKENMFLGNYKLTTVLKEYNIPFEFTHRSLNDTQLIYQLTKKLNGFSEILKKSY
ncbi:MAG: type I-E CRISPR-associated endoribonuclease Cas2e [Clostridiaceae bacterium]